MLSLVVATVLCGETVPLPDKVFGSARVVEFTVSYGKPPRTEGRVLFPPESTDPLPKLALSLTSNSPCLPLARKRKQLKLIAFFDEGGRQLVGVEQDRGEGTDLDPAYPSLVAAVLEAKGWHEERMRAVGPEQLWQPQKKALGSDNPYLRRLAASFLQSHQAADEVDAAWGAPGSVERKQNEARATAQSGAVCPARK